MVVEHIIAGYSIPHNEGAIPLTKEAYDVANPQKRLTDFSKTITIPENKTVNQIFEHCFDVNVDLQSFNPNLKTSYQVIQDGVTVIDGYCQLKSINNVDGLINYQIQATGKVGDLFEKIKDKYLTDLDLSALDHNWTKSNIEDSWSAPIGVEYVYPMIDLGGRSFYGNWSVGDFKPAIYLKQYIDAILSEAGYTYDSTFLNSDLFKRLIIPFGSGKILRDNADILCKEFFAGRTSTQTIQCVNPSAPANLAASIMIFNDDATGDYYDTCNAEYDEITGIYTPLENTKMSLQGVIDFDLTYTDNGTQNVSKFIAYYSQLFNTDFEASVECFVIRKRAGTYSIIQSFSLDITQELIATSINLSGTTTWAGISSSFITNEMLLIAGDEVSISLGNVIMSQSQFGWSYSNFTDFKIDLNTGSTLGSKFLETEIGVGDSISTSLIIPKNVKQDELLSSIIKRFNLYLEYDPIDVTKLIIETRDDYLTTDKVNIEPLVDRSKDYKIKPLGALDAGRFVFKDQLDKDYHNDIYNKVNDEVYGQITIDIDNDFQNSDKTITTIFAPTPLQSIKASDDRIISSIRFVNDNNEQAEATAKIRLLYWGGLLATNNIWGFEGDLKTTYPYAGHLDNPYSPTFDLNWYIPSQLYYDFSIGEKREFLYTNNNCYNVFWKKYIDEITDKNSKILECYLALRPYDYNELSFRKNYYIDGSYWRLLKVEDFDGISEETTKCIFLKVEPKSDFVAQVKVINGGKGTFNDGAKLPTGDFLRRPNSNVGMQQDSLQFGENLAGGTRSIIASDNIEQSIGSKNALIVASSSSGVFADNVVLLNSPNIITSRQGVSYINGLFMEKLHRVELSSGIMNNITQDLQILPPIADDEFYKITRGYLRLNGNKVLGGSSKVSIVTDDISEHLLGEIPSTFFDTDNNTGLLDISNHHTTPIHFGSGVKLTSNSAMTFELATSLTINLVYRIIKL